MARKDDEMLAAYRDGLEYVTRRVREMGGDPEHPTPEQAVAVAEELLDRAMGIRELIGDTSPLPTADDVMRDHRKLQRLKKRRDQ